MYVFFLTPTGPCLDVAFLQSPKPVVTRVATSTMKTRLLALIMLEHFFCECLMVPKLKKGYDTVTLLTNGQLNLINPVTKEPIVKFHAVHEYNQYTLMAAVDSSDQMVSYNAFKRRTLKWWKKSFLPSLHAWCMYKSRQRQRN